MLTPHVLSFPGIEKVSASNLNQTHFSIYPVHFVADNNKRYIIPYNEHHLDLFATQQYRGLTTQSMNMFVLKDPKGLRLHLTEIEVYEKKEYWSQGSNKFPLCQNEAFKVLAMFSIRQVSLVLSQIKLND